MKPFFLTCLTLLYFLPSASQAGAWLRETGTGFVSLSFGATRLSDTTNALYLEYGLTENVTIGLDISAFTNSQDVRNGFGNLFIRRNLGPTTGPHRFAYEIGIGGLWGSDMRLPTVKTGISWGYGFTQNDRPGWVNLDVAYINEPEMGQHIAKLDGTLGLDLTDFTAGLLEFTLSEQNNDAYGAVMPALLFKPKGRAFNVKVGAEIPYKETEKSALKLGLWHRF